MMGGVLTGIYLSFVLVYLVPNVNGEAFCFPCYNLKRCKVDPNFVRYHDSRDVGKVVKKVEGDAANENLDRCLKPGYKISGTLTKTVCSGSNDGLCHSIGEKTTELRGMVFHCGICHDYCGCAEGGQRGNALKEEDAMIVTICLAILYNLM